MDALNDPNRGLVRIHRHERSLTSMMRKWLDECLGKAVDGRLPPAVCLRGLDELCLGNWCLAHGCKAMLITIEGCVGVGKTTVAQGLARHRGSTPLFEEFESNPFLKGFYENPEQNALEVEVTFLLLHSHQLRTTASTLGASSEVVSDFHLWKDLIYADLNLSDQRTLELFRELYALLSERTEKPAVMVCLCARTELILERIARRNREYEKRTNREYFAKLNDAYQTAFERYPGRKICVSMDQRDFVREPQLFQELSVLIDRELQH